MPHNVRCLGEVEGEGERHYCSVSSRGGEEAVRHRREGGEMYKSNSTQDEYMYVALERK